MFPYLALFFISSSTLAYELILMRLFSIIQWYHFAYMVISVALLGFAASGSLLSVLSSRRSGRSLQERAGLYFPLICLLILIFIPITFFVAQKIPFSPFELAWQKKQYLYLVCYYFLFLIPFFLSGCFVGLNFMCWKENIARVYFYNLIGSSAGILVAFVSFYWIRPEMLLVVPMCFSFCGLLFSCPRKNKTKPYLILTAAGALFVSIWLMAGEVHLSISPYKGISKCLQLPGALLEHEGYSPLGLLQVVSAPSLRDAPGLSLKYTNLPPQQKAIFLDGSPHGIVTDFRNNRSNIEYLDYTTFSLGYHLISHKKALILNPEGLNQVLAAHFHGIDHIQVVESHPDVVGLLRGPLRSFSKNIYSHNPHINVDISSPREYLSSQSKRYDIIQLGLAGSLGGEGGGIYATGENYIYTIEAFQQYFEHLNPGGILSASAWLSNPPRAFLKLIALAVETLDRARQGDIALSLVAIRSWATGTVLLKNGRFSREDISKIRTFCKDRGFDLVYLFGIHAREVNRYNILERPFYYNSSLNLLDRNKRDPFYENYIFNVKPPNDDKPYFSHYFRLSALSYLLKTLGREWIPFLEWGYIILWVTLLQVLLLAPVFIFFPLLFVEKKGKPRIVMKGRTFAYFSMIGLAFMFVEMGFIQKFVLLLTQPIYALALIIFTLTLFSGIGSLLSRSLGIKGMWVPFAGIIVVSGAYIVFLDPLLRTLLHYPILLKSAAGILLLAPLALFMGMPFPTGLQLVSNHNSDYIPWVWSINGLASVIAPVLGSLLTVNLGFRPLMLLSLLLYILAFLSIYSMSLTYRHQSRKISLL